MVQPCLRPKTAGWAPAAQSVGRRGDRNKTAWKIFLLLFLITETDELTSNELNNYAQMQQSILVNVRQYRTQCIECSVTPFFMTLHEKFNISALQEEKPFQQCMKLVTAHPLIRCGTDKNE